MECENDEREGKIRKHQTGNENLENKCTRIECKGGQRGVAVLCDQEVGNRVTKIVPHSDRLLLVRIKANPVDIVLLKVYMPTTEAEDDEIELMYEQIEDLIKKEKATDQVIIMGD